MFTSLNQAAQVLQGRDPLICVSMALAVAIRDAKAQYGPNSKPLPPEVIEVLSRIYPVSLLNKMRYAVGEVRIALPDTIFGVDSLLGALDLKIPDLGAAAVTLDNVIVFKKTPDFNKLETLVLTAHEVFHGQQYEEWGIDQFAYNYTRNARGVEDEARHAESHARSYLERLERGERAITPVSVHQNTILMPKRVETPLGPSYVLVPYDPAIVPPDVPRQQITNFCTIDAPEGPKPGFIVSNSTLIMPQPSYTPVGEKQPARSNSCLFDIHLRATGQTLCVNSNGHIIDDNRRVGACLPCSAGNCPTP